MAFVFQLKDNGLVVCVAWYHMALVFAIMPLYNFLYSLIAQFQKTTDVTDFCLQFLQACTGRLELRKHAKKAYDWDGNVITDLEESE